jgi:hypothetical protein
MTDNEPSTLSEIVFGATKNPEPGLTAKIIGGLITKDPTASDAAAHLAQMVMGAALPAMEGFMAATHRQHALETAPFYLIDDAGNPVFLAPIETNNNNIHNKITIKNNSNMARQTSYEYQIEIAEGLKKYLHNFQDRLGVVAQQYQSKCNDLHGAGMMEETHQKFEQEYVHETIRQIAQVVDRINACDIPFIEKHIAALEQGRSL